MKTYISQPKSSDTVQPKSSKQASPKDVLQAYKNKIVQRQDIDEDELLQGKFSDTAQLEELEEDELLQGKFDTAQHEEIDEDELSQGKFDASFTIQKEEVIQPVSENNTGMPDNLKNGIEALSGYSMDDVRVHYNSDKPAQLQALAYAQGTDIHIASGQEQHLPHEAWHIVQQKQGRVQPTTQLQGVNVNDNEGLEKEADVMGGKAVNTLYNTNKNYSIQMVNIATLQMVTDAPKSIKIQIQGGSVIRVIGQDGGELPFVNALEHTGLVKEGYVVIINLDGKTPSVRFAKEDTNIEDLGKLFKINNCTKENIPEIPSSSSPIIETVSPLIKNDFKVSKDGNKSLFPDGMGLTGFENSEKGQIHFDKHGSEFSGINSKTKYIKQAQDFGREISDEFVEIKIKNTYIRYQASSHKILISNGKKILTFYVWNPDFSSDPVTYAIYYTITHNMKMPLSAVPEEVILHLNEANFDIIAMENEYISKCLKEKISSLEEGIEQIYEQIHTETLAPVLKIKNIHEDIKQEVKD